MEQITGYEYIDEQINDTLTTLTEEEKKNIHNIYKLVYSAGRSEGIVIGKKMTNNN